MAERLRKRISRHIALLVAAVLVFSVCCVILPVSGETPQNSEGGEIPVSSAEELTAVDAFDDEKGYVLTSDIDLTGVAWEPRALTSSFDGNSHHITGLTAPLFSTVTGSVTRLTLDGTNIASGLCVGALAETVEGASVSHISVTGATVRGVTAGGIIGEIVTNANIPQTRVNACVFDGTVVGGEGGAGGIVGSATAFVRFDGCVSYGTVTAKDAGGILGVYNVRNPADLHVLSCANAGAVTSDGGYAGHFVGRIAGEDEEQSSILFSACYAPGAAASDKTADNPIFGGLETGIAVICRTAAVGATLYNKERTGNFTTETLGIDAETGSELRTALNTAANADSCTPYAQNGEKPMPVTVKCMESATISLLGELVMIFRVKAATLPAGTTDAVLLSDTGETYRGELDDDGNFKFTTTPVRARDFAKDKRYTLAVTLSGGASYTATENVSYSPLFYACNMYGKVTGEVDGILTALIEYGYRAEIVARGESDARSIFTEETGFTAYSLADYVSHDLLKPAAFTGGHTLPEGCYNIDEINAVAETSATLTSGVNLVFHLNGSEQAKRIDALKVEVGKDSYLYQVRGTEDERFIVVEDLNAADILNTVRFSFITMASECVAYGEYSIGNYLDLHKNDEGIAAMVRAAAVYMRRVAIYAEIVKPFTPENIYTVTFDSDGGSAVETEKIAKGETAMLPIAPVKEEATFDGWYNGDELYDFNTPVTEDLLLTAKWEDNHTHKWVAGAYHAGDCCHLGYTEYTCVCGEEKTVYDEEYGPHTFRLTYTVDREATASVPGVESRHCIYYDHCHGTTEPREIPWQGADIKPGRI